MARNRKYQSAAIRFGPALKAFLLCLLIGGSAVGYVWQKNQIYQLGQQIKMGENHLKQLAEKNIILDQQLQRMRELPFQSEEHTSELQSRFDLVCRLLLEKKE